METDGLGIQIREHLDGAKPPTGAKDRGNIAALKEIPQGPGPLLIEEEARQMLASHAGQVKEMDHYKMFLLIKQKLAQKKEFVL